MENTVGSRFREWIGQQRPAGATFQAQSQSQLLLMCQSSHAQINFYPYVEDVEICELCIYRNEEESPSFYLHFVLDDLARAQELFGEMAEVLEANEQRQTTHVLLCCTSAITTTFFADKLNSVAQGLGLDYEFEAMPYVQALTDPGDYPAIMLAPQAAHMRRDLAAAHPRSLVFELPGKVFGTYDAAGALHMLMHALGDGREQPKDVESLRPMRSSKGDFNVLVITMFALRREARLGYRLYRGGMPILEGLVRKAELDFRDVEDLIQTMGARNVDLGELDAIGIAVPGAVTNGVVHLREFSSEAMDLGPHLSERFGIPVFVDNNCNAAAVACYVSQRDYENVVFFKQEFGHLAGGFGTVLHGHLVLGSHSMAGEPKFFERRFSYEPYGSYDDARWTYEGMFQIATNVTLASIALISPEAVYLAVDTVDDVVALRAEIAREVGDDRVPAIHIVDDYVERVYLGEMAMCTQRLLHRAP